MLAAQLSVVLFRYLACALLAPLFLALGGCASPAEQPDEGEIVIRFWNGFTGPGTPHIEDLVRQFNREYAGQIRVEMSIMLWADLYIKLPLSLKGRFPADCGATHIPQTAAFAQAGMLEPIGPYLEGFDVDDVFENAWEPGAIDGKRYGVPMAINPLTLFWNKKLFRAAGLDPERPPRDRGEFLAYAKQLTRDTDGDGETDIWGTMIPLGWPTHFTFYSILFSNGGQLVSDVHRTNLCGEAPGLDAAQFLYDLIYTLKVSPPNVEISADAEGFSRGKSAMEINGLWMYPEFAAVDDLELGCALLPNLGTEDRVVWCSSENLVVFKHRYSSPERTAACVAFFRYLSAHSQNWAKVGTLPARKSLYEDGSILDLPHVRGVYPEIGDARILIRSMFVEESLGPVLERLTKSLAGKGDPREEIREGAALSTRLLQQDPD